MGPLVYLQCEVFTGRQAVVQPGRERQAHGRLGVLHGLGRGDALGLELETLMFERVEELRAPATSPSTATRNCKASALP